MHQDGELVIHSQNNAEWNIAILDDQTTNGWQELVLAVTGIVYDKKLPPIHMIPK